MIKITGMIVALLLVWIVGYREGKVAGIEKVLNLSHKQFAAVKEVKEKENA